MATTKLSTNLCIIVCLLTFGCNSRNNRNEQVTEKTELLEAERGVERQNPEDDKLKRLKTEASRLRAGGSVKSVELNESKATITYVSDYSEYKKINPQSSLTAEDLNAYWKESDAIQKALVDGSVRIMRKLDFINQVQIILPYSGLIYSIDVPKSELESFLDTDFNAVVSNWDSKFSDPYVYDDEGRQKFFNRFSESN